MTRRRGFVVHAPLLTEEVIRRRVTCGPLTPPPPLQDETATERAQAFAFGAQP
jgi:hypothetical protein